MFCNHCGTQNEKQANYCCNEGAVLKQSTTKFSLRKEQSHFCGDCGSKNFSHALYCGACGFSLQVKSTTAMKAPTVPANNKKVSSSNNFKKYGTELSSLFRRLGGGNIINKLKIGLSGILILAFFLPWFSIDLIITEGSISGFKLVEVFTSEIVLMFESGAKVFYVLYLIPLLAFMALIKAKSRVWSLMAGIFTLLICFVAVRIANEGIPLFEFLDYGGYLTFLSAIGLVVTSFMKADEGHTVSTSVEA
jgi:hypothetical protein